MSRDELLKSLREQVRFIDKSCAEFDRDDTSEAKRLAVTVRVLLHDTKQSKSLLGKLASLQTFIMLDSASFDMPGNAVAYHGLVGLRSGPNGLFFRPHCLMSTGQTDEWRHRSFNRWWNADVIDDRRGNCISRRDIVLALANKEGGAHIDSDLPNEYRAISRENSIGISGGPSDNSKPIQDTVVACMRQIAEEVRQSLVRKFTSLRSGLLLKSMIASHKVEIAQFGPAMRYQFSRDRGVVGRTDLLNWPMRAYGPPIYGPRWRMVLATKAFIWFQLVYRRR